VHIYIYFSIYKKKNLKRWGYQPIMVRHIKKLKSISQNLYIIIKINTKTKIKMPTVISQYNRYTTDAPTDIQTAQFACDVAKRDYMDSNKVISVRQNWVRVSNERGVSVALDLTAYIRARVDNEKLLNETKAIVAKENAEQTKSRIGSYISNYKLGKATKKVCDLEKTLRETIDIIEVTEMILERCNERIEGNKTDLDAAVKDKERKNTTMIRAQDTLYSVKIDGGQNKWI